jgi:hypothetical protein
LPSFSVSSAISPKIELWRLIERAEFTWHPQKTWSVVSSFVQPSGQVLTVDFDPGPPRTGSIPSKALSRKCHSLKDSGVQHYKRFAFSLATSRAYPVAIFPC